MAFGDSPFSGTVDAPSSNRRKPQPMSSPFGGMGGGAGEGTSAGFPGSMPMAGPNSTFSPAGFGSAPFGPPSGPVNFNAGDAAAMPGNTSQKNLQTVLANQYNQDIGVRGGLLNENEKALDFNNLTSSPLYHANLTGANEATASAYDKAVSNARARAISSGFGYASPIEQGSETGIRGQEASQLGRNPASALLQTVAPTLQAAQIRTGEMGQFSPNPTLDEWIKLVGGNSQASAGMMSGLMQALGAAGSAAITAYGGGGGG